MSISLEPNHFLYVVSLYRFGLAFFPCTYCVPHNTNIQIQSLYKCDGLYTVKKIEYSCHELRFIFFFQFIFELNCVLCGKFSTFLLVFFLQIIDFEIKVHWKLLFISMWRKRTGTEIILNGLDFFPRAIEMNGNILWIN